MARVLVTGGDGFVGRHVVAVLRGGGHDVTWTTLQPDPDPAAITLDLREPGALDGHLDGVGAVVHLAARAGGVGFQRMPDPTVAADNRALTDSVLGAATAAGIPRVFLASSAVVYRPADRPLREGDPLLSPADRPSPYAWSKISDEVAAGWSMAAHPDTRVVIGRFANVYGPGGPDGDETGTVVHTLIRRAGEAAAAGEPLRVWGDPAAVRSFVFVTDVARAVALLATSPDAEGVYNVDTGIPMTIRSVAEIVAAAVDPALAIVVDAAHPSDVPYRVTDPGRLAALGHAPEVDFPDGVARCVAAARG